VGPDWDPRPAEEYLSYIDRADLHPPPVDARFPALELLFFLAELRRALGQQDAPRAACAAFQVAEARAALVNILRYGMVLDAGGMTVYGGGTRRRDGLERRRRWRERSEELKKQGLSQRGRAQKISEEEGVRFHTVRAELQKLDGKLPRTRARKKFSV
jgi:hypothetical protein